MCSVFVFLLCASVYILTFLCCSMCWLCPSLVKWHVLSLLVFLHFFFTHLFPFVFLVECNWSLFSIAALSVRLCQIVWFHVFVLGYLFCPVWFCSCFDLASKSLLCCALGSSPAYPDTHKHTHGAYMWTNTQSKPTALLYSGNGGDFVKYPPFCTFVLLLRVMAVIPPSAVLLTWGSWPKSGS